MEKTSKFTWPIALSFVLGNVLFVISMIVSTIIMTRAIQIDSNFEVVRNDGIIQINMIITTVTYLFFLISLLVFYVHNAIILIKDHQQSIIHPIKLYVLFIMIFCACLLSWSGSEETPFAPILGFLFFFYQIFLLVDILTAFFNRKKPREKYQISQSMVFFGKWLSMLMLMLIGIGLLVFLYNLILHL